jgi:hypothetical protein
VNPVIDAKKVQIERKSRVEAADFFAHHLAGVGRPLIVTDAIDAWPARTKWTFEHFRASYGSDFVVPSSGVSAVAGKLTKLSAFIDWLDTPEAELQGLWVELPGQRPLRAAPSPLPPHDYLIGWLALKRHPELYDDMLPAPYFVDDWVLALDPDLRTRLEKLSTRVFWSLLVCAAGARTELHQDFWSTHAYLAQVQGRKHVLLFSPEDSARLYEGAVDPSAPDLATHPLFAGATAHEAVLAPGETLFMPADWWHWVHALDKSITVSHNFFNATNFSEHLRNLLEAASGDGSPARD